MAAMSVADFASRHRLRVRRDECGERIITGKRGHIYEHSESLMGLLFAPSKPRMWANARKKLQAAGFVIKQDGDEEGTALFDPCDTQQVALALRLVGVRPKRVPSPAQLGVLRKARAAQVRSTHCARAGVAA